MAELQEREKIDCTPEDEILDHMDGEDKQGKDKSDRGNDDDTSA